MNKQRLDIVYPLLEKSGQVLMVENRHSWSLPGGKREARETLEEAVVREAKKETGWDVAVNGIVNINERIMETQDVFFTFQGNVISGELDCSQDGSVKQVVWMEIDEVEQLISWYRGLHALLNQHASYVAESHCESGRSAI